MKKHKCPYGADGKKGQVSAPSEGDNWACGNLGGLCDRCKYDNDTRLATMISGAILANACIVCRVYPKKRLKEKMSALLKCLKDQGIRL